MKQYTITSGDLTAYILPPESPEYARTRFNHSALVTDVVYQGVHFGQKEQTDPAKSSTMGAGLYCELVCPEVENTVAVGEEYVKPGVGYVTRMEKPWFFGDNPPYRPFDTVVTAQSDRILFVTESEEIGGVAYRECRMLKAEGNTLTLSVHFENIGEKTLNMQEFCHNFISLGDLKTGAKHHLALPGVIDPRPNPDKKLIIPEEGGVTWPENLSETFFNAYENVRECEGPAWTLTHEDSSVSISETVDFTPVKLALWGLSHVISPEVFLKVSIAPGESADWSRKWTFTAAGRQAEPAPAR